MSIKLEFGLQYDTISPYFSHNVAPKFCNLFLLVDAIEVFGDGEDGHLRGASVPFQNFKGKAVKDEKT